MQMRKTNYQEKNLKRELACHHFKMEARICGKEQPKVCRNQDTMLHFMFIRFWDRIVAVK